MKNQNPLLQKFLDDLREGDDRIREYLRAHGFDDFSQSEAKKRLAQLGFDLDITDKVMRSLLAPRNPSTPVPVQKHQSRSSLRRVRKRPRWKASIGTHAAARRMEAYIKSHGMNLKEFAKRAGTTDKTLRKFRRIGRIKRSVFDDIAKAMGLTRDGLLKR
jgi:hypothetical protein